ncbi:MAG: LysR family transcriptional regulator [[Clostridium] symbiosum]
MDLKQLQYFLTIVEEGSITAAAARLHVTQPPLSQLKKLEKEFNVVLFERDSRNLQLTAVGQMFADRARQLLALSNVIQKEIVDFSSGYKGNLYIGITPTAVPLVLSPKIAEFHQNYPMINFEFFEGNSAYIHDLVQKGIIDIGIIRSPFHLQGIKYLKKEPEPMVAVMSPEYNWSDCVSCSVDELDGKQLIIYRRYESILNEVFNLHNVLPRIICKAERSSSALRAAESGLGIALLPSGATQMAQEKIVQKILDDDCLYTSPMAIWAYDHYLNKSAMAFLDYFRSL